MPWDPSQRPRVPRLRSSHHFIQSPADRRYWFKAPRLELSEAEVDAFADQIGGTLPRALLIYFIRAAAREFGWARQQAGPSRELIRYELRLIAHLIWKAEHRPDERKKARKEFFGRFWDIDELTRDRLYDGIAKARPDEGPPVYMVYGPGGVQFDALYEGALIADRSFASRGDHPDLALHHAIAFLIWIFDMAKDALPTVGRTSTGGYHINPHTVAGSSFAMFAYSFFRHVDERLTRERITTSMARRLSEVRKRKQAGHKDYHDLANLFD